jgi:hypothetical protein
MPEPSTTTLDRVLASTTKAPAPIIELVCPKCGKGGLKAGSRRSRIFVLT